MGEANTLARLVIALGVIFLFVAALYPGSETGWNQFSESLGGQNFPTFTNPFDASNLFATLYPGGPSTPPIYTGTAIGTNNGCADNNDDYWKCMRDYNGTDSEESYLALTTPIDLIFGAYTNFFLTSDTGNGRFLQSITTDVWCQSSGTNEAIGLDEVGYIDEKNDGTDQNAFQNIQTSVQYCPLSPKWGKISIDSTVTTQPNTGSDRRFVLQLGTLENISGTELRISTVVVRMTFSDATSCAGGDFFTNLGCQLSAIWDAIVKFFALIANGTIFGGQVIAFVFSLIGGVLIGLFSSIAFFFAVPGAPSTVQAIISAIFVGILAWILYIILKTVRGTSTI